MPTHTKGWAHWVPSKVRAELSGLGVYIHVDTTGRYQWASWAAVVSTMRGRGRSLDQRSRGGRAHFASRATASEISIRFLNGAIGSRADLE